MIFYIILSILFSIGTALTVLETYASYKSTKKKILLFIISFVLSLLLWPIFLVIIDVTLIWNSILGIKHGKITLNNKENEPVELNSEEV